MKLAATSIPYRALQKTSTIAISAVFIASIGTAGLGVPALGAVIAGGFLLALGYEVAYYRRFEYELTEDTLDIRSGVFNRREREIPYGRIQNVDSSRNVFQRLVGLAALSIETAGGGSTEAALQYVTPFEAERLQLDIRRAKRGESPTGNADTGATDADAATDQGGRAGGAGPPAASGTVDRELADEEEVLFEIAPSELALAGILSFDPRVPGAILALSTGSVPFVSPLIPIDAPPLVLVGLLALLVAAGVVLAWIVGAISAVVNYWGFRLTRSAEELRYERGLLQRYTGTIPFDKIQAITITDNPLKRRAGYATLVVETAGYAPSQTDGRGSEAAVPIAGRDRVDQLADEIEACEAGRFERPPKRIRRRYLVRYLLGVGALAGLLYGGAALFASTDAVPWPLLGIAALSTPLAAHYKWVHRGYRLGEDHLVTRNGFWSRETKRVAYYRIQTVIDSRTVFQRRWSVATVTADTAGSLSILGTDAAAVDIDQGDADRLRAELTDRLRTALAERRRQRRGGSFFFDTVEPVAEPRAADESPDSRGSVDDDTDRQMGDGDSDAVDPRRDGSNPEDVDGHENDR